MCEKMKTCSSRSNQRGRDRIDCRGRKGALSRKCGFRRGGIFVVAIVVVRTVAVAVAVVVRAVVVVVRAVAVVVRTVVIVVRAVVIVVIVAAIALDVLKCLGNRILTFKYKRHVSNGQFNECFARHCGS